MRAVCASLGTWGVIYSITYKVEDMYNVHVINKKYDMKQAIEDGKKWVTDNECIQFFWMPFNTEVWIQTANRTKKPSQFVPFKNFWYHFTNWLNQEGAQIPFAALAKHPSWTPKWCKLAFSLIPQNEVVQKISDFIMFDKEIDTGVRTDVVDVAFECDSEYKNFQKAWWMVVDKILELAKEDKFPVNTMVTARLIGPSTCLLGPVGSAARKITCAMEVTSSNNAVGWDEFAVWVANSLGDLPGARPHWAKYFQKLPDYGAYFRKAYGEDLKTFLELRKKHNVDPDNMFVNDYLATIFWGDKKADPSSNTDQD